MSDTLFISIFIFLVLTVVFGYRLTNNRFGYRAAEKLRIFQTIVFLALFAFHGVRTMQIAPFFLLLFLGFMISFFLEHLGVSRGWIFGSYHYTDTACPLPKIGGVPLCYPLAWAGLIYAGFWTVLLWVQPINGQIQLSWSVIARTALVVTIIDLILDPVAVDEKRWIWKHRGKYYGVPWTNFVGWIITVTVIMFIFRQMQAGELTINYYSPLSRIYPSMGFAVLAAVSVRPCIERRLYIPAIIGVMTSITIIIKTVDLLTGI